MAGIGEVIINDDNTYTVTRYIWPDGGDHGPISTEARKVSGFAHGLHLTRHCLHATPFKAHTRYLITLRLAPCRSCFGSSRSSLRRSSS